LGCTTPRRRPGTPSASAPATRAPGPTNSRRLASQDTPHDNRNPRQLRRRPAPPERRPLLAEEREAVPVGVGEDRTGASEGVGHYLPDPLLLAVHVVALNATRPPDAHPEPSGPGPTGAHPDLELQPGSGWGRSPPGGDQRIEPGGCLVGRRGHPPPTVESAVVEARIIEGGVRRGRCGGQIRLARSSGPLADEDGILGSRRDRRVGIVTLEAYVGATRWRGLLGQRGRRVRLAKAVFIYTSSYELQRVRELSVKRCFRTRARKRGLPRT
jgi:hypothetical protein